MAATDWGLTLSHGTSRSLSNHLTTTIPALAHFILLLWVLIRSSIHVDWHL